MSTDLMHAPADPAGLMVAGRPLHWCLGMWGSGSTWLYNAVLKVAAVLHPGQRVAGQFAYFANELVLDHGPDVLVVVKSHETVSPTESILSAAAAAIVISVRDPRDATASLMTYMRHDFAASLARVANAAAACARMAADPRALLLRYEDGFTDRPETLDRIAATYGGTLGGADRDRIYAQTRRGAIEAQIHDLVRSPEALHLPQIGDVLDPATQWHAHHAGRTGEIGRWRRELSGAQARAVERATAAPMRLLYPAGWPGGPSRPRLGRSRTPFIDPAAVGQPLRGDCGGGLNAGGDIFVQLGAALTIDGGTAPPLPPPATGARLCLNMIVRNEAKIIERCLAAVAPYLDAWVICDTGSTDGTQDIIRGFFDAHGIPGELHEFAFENFEQARNEALRRARASSLAFDYLLLTDADMELKVEDPGFRQKLTASSYRVVQRAGISYWNTRLLRRDHPAAYVGVTHEYLRMQDEMARIEGAWFLDHAQGSSRPLKFRRDTKLLLDDLADNPDNPRSHFYLAQTYKGERMWAEAIRHYQRRIELGGWQEEAWYARWQLAQCLRESGDTDGFLREMPAVWNARPHRAEPLYDLVRFYRNRGMNELACLYCEEALALPWPKDDALFIDDWVYDFGLRQEMSIVGFYSRRPTRRAQGGACAQSLALGRDVPQAQRDLARRNGFFYGRPARDLLPGLSITPVPFAPPDDYRPMNPSIARWDDALWMIQRSVNYVVTDGGGYLTHDGGPVRTRNFLLRLNQRLEIVASTEMLPPADWPAPQRGGVLGWEDCRLFAWRGALWCSANTRELTAEGWAEMLIGRLDGAGTDHCRLADWRVLRPAGPKRHEKNWMPLVADDTLRFIYACDPMRLVDPEGATLSERPGLRALDHLRGGSQAIAFDGGWLALTHEVQIFGHRRRYLHRFLRFDAGCDLAAISPAFYLLREGIEYVAGLAWHPDWRHLLVSFGVNDGESWIAKLAADALRPILEPTPPEPPLPSRRRPA